ncbi:hypothetical protein ACQ859_16960 [Roseateles chitinivorans]|uniref:hypothetical protein n=1 Tax=Roseateles TaxID=93681 RepID=UPI00366C23F3
MDWRSWTYIIAGSDMATSGRIVDLDFQAGKVTYLRETGRPFDANPHPLGSHEYEAYLYDTIEARYEHLWVNPQRSAILSREDYDCLVVQHKKPSSFIELVDVDPRAYFEGDVLITSASGCPSDLAP